MSLPASNNPAEVISSLKACLSETQAQLAAMEALRETGDRLFTSICQGHTGSLDAILEARSAACVKLNQLAATASPVRGDLDQLAAASAYPEIRETAAEILRTTRQVDLLRIKIMTAQNECEEALRAAVADTARQLRQAAGEKKVRLAYNAATVTTPRYLDSRK